MLGKAINYWKIFGAREFLKRVYYHIGISIFNKKNNPVIEVPADQVQSIVNNKFPNTSKLPLYSLGHSGKRVSFVTDSLCNKSFFGGVATALIFAIYYVEKEEKSLRIITRTEKGGQKNFFDFLKRENLKLTKKVEFIFLDLNEKNKRSSYFEDEIFITTSWWTTYTVMQTIKPKNIIYLLQEDERMFYSYGDEHLKCTETLSSEGITILINTELLYDHFVSQGFKNIEKNAIWFEPAFNVSNKENPNNKTDKKRRLFFYSRPLHPRNLYYRGIEVLDKAVLTGLIDTSLWEIYFVGSNSEAVIFSTGLKPFVLENMPWDEYLEFLTTVDLGVSLMYTPHPSYPPLDIASAGAVVVTNKFGDKQSLNKYSNNIICSDLSVDSLLEALSEGIKLAENYELKQKNSSESSICFSWEKSFDKVLARLKN